ncbi:MAG: putative porin [Candidatus Omnitrophica bacterium]|nr:putative porin [Candidatus Omnitrophota bacterium]
MKKVVVMFLLTGLMCIGGVIDFSHAGEIDLLLQKLVDKGVLTPGEAQQVRTETKEEMRKEIVQGKSETLPGWLQTMKLKGDFRFRVQNNHPKTAGQSENERLRARIRLRLGLEAKVNDQLLVAAGFATGTTDTSSADAARSTNQTLGDSFAKKAINLDYAYAQYTPVGWAVFTAGKMKLLPWEPADLIWDTDITPEGAAVQLSKNINSKTTIFFTSMLGVIDELSSESSDPVMYVLQPGVQYQLSDTVSLKGAFSYYDFANIKGRALDGSTGTNSHSSGSYLRYNYRPISPAIEIGIKEPFKAIGINVPYASLFGEYVNNIAISSKNKSGYALGFKVGAEKIQKWGDWDLKYIYAMLEKDAVPDILPDSDRYGGKTGIRSHEVMFNYGLSKNTFFGVDVYRSWALASAQAPETIVQLDWNMKF